MKNFYEINYEKNMEMLEEASRYCNENYDHERLIYEINIGNDLKKQFCLIEINTVKSEQEAELIVSHLINHIGPVREAASYKISELIKIDELNAYFQSVKIIDTFVKSITDINPSVSRNAVEIIKYVDDSQYLYKKIINELNKTISEIKEVKKIRSYELNKKNFNIYWNLEAIISISDKITPNDDILNILKYTALSPDYTIREKTAKTALILSERNPNFKSITDILKDDSNMYVKKYIK